MKKLVFLFMIAVLSIAYVANAQSAKELFNQRCAVCHMPKPPTEEQRKNLIAPPAPGVMHHVKQRYKTRKSAVDFVVNYALYPSKDKSVCLPKTIKKFGVMPSQKGSVSREQLKAIAEYMYDNFPPKGIKPPDRESGLMDNTREVSKNLSGRALAKQYGCMSCHNVYGPKQAPGFAGIAKRSLMFSKPVQYIVDAIKNGSKGKYPKFANMVMPPFGSINSMDREKIARWILSLGKWKKGMKKRKGKGRGGMMNKGSSY